MKKFKPVLIIAAMTILTVPTHPHDARGQGPDPRVLTDDVHTKASIWMQHKLGASQSILEGMTRGDYEKIAQNAKGMQVMGYLESWIRANTPEYKAQLHAFDYANGAIVRAAHEKNLDGVTLAYTQLTISCVQCHKIVRDKPKQ
jgi:hypothetical protein